METEAGHDAHQAGDSSRRRRVLEAFGVVALALAINLFGNDRVSLWDRDEPRYAVCTREMAARGDWIYPTFNSEPRFHKPVLIYWLMRAGFAVGGDNPFGARLVSATAGAASCLLLLALGRRMFGPRIGLLAALMLTTAPIMVIESKLATTDATLTFFLLASQFCLWELSKRPSKAIAATFWVCMGLATLTKGPVGLALIATAGLVSWCAGGPREVWKRLCWRWGVLVWLVITAPWFIVVGIQSRGAFFRFAVGHQIAERVMSGMEQHGGFPGYYLVTSLLTFHPWSALLPAALLGAWTRRRADPAFGFLIGWTIGPLILLECVKTKLIHYYLPAFPACALLVAWLIEAVAKEEISIRRWPLGRLGLGLLAGVGIGVTATLFAGSAAPSTSAMRWPFFGTALIIGSGTLWGLTRFYQRATLRAAYALVATWAIAMLALGGCLLPSAEPYRTSQVIGRKLLDLVEEHQVEPVLLSFQEPSVIYAMGRSAVQIRTWDQFYEELDRHGEVLTAILYPIEAAEFDRRTELEVRVLDTVQNFNLNKGATQTLELALIRRRPPSDLSMIAGRTGSEQIHVK